MVDKSVSGRGISPRTHFLNLKWQKYPNLLKANGGVVNGRITARSGELLTLQIADVIALDPDRQLVPKNLELDFSNSKWRIESLQRGAQQDDTPPVTAVLQIGDWVQVDTKIPYEVHLVSPCLNVQRYFEGRELPARQSQWSHFVTQIRDEMKLRNYLEINTDSLVDASGTEPYLDPIRVQFSTLELNSQSKFLITSPEFSHKKLLSAGCHRIFEVAKSYRAKEGGAHHLTEFHMLEWYAAFADLSVIKDDLKALLKRLTGHEVQFFETTVTKLFAEVADIKLHAEEDVADLKEQLRKKRIFESSETSESYSDLFHRVWVEKIDPYLAEQKLPMIVSEYPQSLAALARIGSNGYAERFEFFWRGLEIANAYNELVDPQENYLRLKRDNEIKKSIGKCEIPVDETFLQCLEAGLPPTVGIALGLERLYMALFDEKSIHNLR